MKFSDLLRLRRDKQSGNVPESTLRKLNLPMPEGVFNQLVRDHATTAFTQICYGQLELHAIHWKDVRFTASAIAAAAVHKAGLDLVGGIEKHASRVTQEGWQGISLSGDSIERWKRHRTWIELPLFVQGSIVMSTAAMQLVEGHCRLGTFRGLLRCGWLERDSTHAVWLGCEQKPSALDASWKQIVREEGISFVDWLTGLPFRGGETDQISRYILDAACAKILDGETTPSAVLAFSRSHPHLKCMLTQLHVLEGEWRDYISP